MTVLTKNAIQRDQYLQLNIAKIFGQKTFGDIGPLYHLKEILKNKMLENFRKKFESFCCHALLCKGRYNIQTGFFPGQNAEKSPEKINFFFGPDFFFSFCVIYSV